MFIDMKRVRDAFVDYETKLSDQGSAYCICTFCRLDHAQMPYNHYTLYLTDNIDTLNTLRPVDGMYLLFCTDSNSQSSILSGQQDVPVNLLQVIGCSLTNAEFILTNFFSELCGRGLFAETLLDILFTENGIQAMLDKIYPAFSNPLMVFDADYHLIAANWQEVSKSEAGRRIVENKGFADQEFELVNHMDHIHKRLMKSKTPILVHHPELGFDQLLCPVSTEKNLGHIVLSALNQPLNDHDPGLLMLLQKALDQQLKKDEFIRNNRGFHYEYFIKDLLDGKIATAPQHLNRLSYVEKEFRGLLYCVVVETGRSSSTLNTLHIRSEFEHSFSEAKTLLYNGEIIILLKKADFKPLRQKDIKELNHICVDHGIFAGISNCFKDIFKLADYFKQSLRAIELGICECNEPSLFVYENYYLQHMVNIFSQKESPDTFCHPKLRMLFDYDHKHDTHLAETLYMYLVNERNYSAAAEAMFIHRNTMIYRMKKIDEMIDIDYNNYKERQYIILSYELNHS